MLQWMAHVADNDLIFFSFCLCREVLLTHRQDGWQEDLLSFPYEHLLRVCPIRAQSAFRLRQVSNDTFIVSL